MTKTIVLPARGIPEQTLGIDSLLVIPSQSRLIVNTTEMGTQFERTLTEAELESVLSLVEPAVKAKVAEASVVDVAVEGPKEEPKEKPVPEGEIVG
jgi:hypothetical protein